jgi:hypothetical protein
MAAEPACQNIHGNIANAGKIGAPRVRLARGGPASRCHLARTRRSNSAKYAPAALVRNEVSIMAGLRAPAGADAKPMRASPT